MLDIGVWNPRVGLQKAGGTETFVRNIASELADMNDVTVTVYTHTNGELPQALQSVTVKRVPTLPKEHRVNKLLSKTPILDSEIESLASTFNGSLRRVFKNMNHDVVSTHYYLDGLLLSRLLDTPVTFRLPGIKQPSPRWKALFKFSDVDTYIANSQTTVDRVRTWFDRELVGPVYAGVDCNRFEPTEGRDQTILYVGRLGQGKGLRKLCMGAQDLPNGYTLRVVGDGPLKAELQNMAPDTVEFVGTIPHSEIHREYQNASAFVLPSVHEGFPVVMIEALACGTPVIATDLDATRLTIDDGETGVLLENRNPDTIANAIHQVSESKAYTRNARTIGRATAQQYDWKEQAIQFAEILDTAV